MFAHNGRVAGDAIRAYIQSDSAGICHAMRPIKSCLASDNSDYQRSKNGAVTAVVT